MKRLFKDIFDIVPVHYKKKHFLRFIMFSISNVVLDLISIVYLIPVFILILDPKKKSALYIFQYIDKANLIYFSIVFVLTFIFKNYLQIRINNYQQTVIFNIASDISSESLASFLKKEYLLYQKKNTAKSMESIKIIGADFSNHILLSLNTIIVEGLLITVLILISLYFYFQVTVAIIVFLGSLLFTFFFFKRVQFRGVNSSLRETYASVTSELLNIIHGFLEIKSLQFEAFFQRKFNQSVKTFNNNFARLNQHKYSNGKYLEGLILLCLVFFFFFIYASNETSTNQVILTSFLAGSFIKLLPSINKITIAYTHFQSYKYTIDILKNAHLKRIEKRVPVVKFEQKIELINVNFGYKTDNLLIKRLNMSIIKGDFIGISGPSASGKTTLLNLIMNTISPDSGTYIIDGNTITEIHDLYPIINYVPQNSFVFEGTILENIVLGQHKKDIDITRIINLANVLELSKLFEERLTAKIDINSLELSGGQKQRIAILRSLYHDFEILILDEATNQVNKTLEAKIYRYLQKIQQQEQKTIIYISHNTDLKQYSNRFFKIKNNYLVKD